MKELKKIFRFVFPFFKPYKRIVITFFIVSTIDSLFTTVDALALGWLIDSMLYKQTMDSIVICSISFFAIKVISFILCYCIKTRDFWREIAFFAIVFL